MNQLTAREVQQQLLGLTTKEIAYTINYTSGVLKARAKKDIPSFAKNALMRASDAIGKANKEVHTAANLLTDNGCEASASAN